MALKLAKDDGYLEVEVEAQGGPVAFHLDLFEANNVYATLCDQFDPSAKPELLAPAWLDWLAGKGCPPVSHGQAFLIAATVASEVAAFKKKHALGSARADSGSSSASPSSPVPSAT